MESKAVISFPPYSDQLIFMNYNLIPTLFGYIGILVYISFKSYYKL